MANKSFGTKQLDLTGASGSPIITSPSDLSINATTVAISTNVSVGGYFSSNVNVGTGYSVGIGTTIPVAELEVRGDIGLSGSIVATGNTFTVKTSGSERLRITPAGLVGIGTDNPATPLHVYHPTDNGVAQFESGDATTWIGFRDSTSTYPNIPNIGCIGDDFRYKSGSTEKLRIKSTGAIGVGATAWEGTSGQVLTSLGGASPTWRHTNVPMWFGTPADNTQTTTSGTWTTVTSLTDNPIDKGNGGWNASTGVFTCPVGDAGIYWVYGVTGIDDVQEGNQVRTGFSKNGANPPVWAENRNPHDTNQICTSGMHSRTVSLAEGDTIKMQTYHNEGSNDETVRASRTLFGGYRLSA